MNYEKISKITEENYQEAIEDMEKIGDFIIKNEETVSDETVAYFSELADLIEEYENKTYGL